MAASSSYKLIAKKGQGGMAEVYKAIKSGPDGFSKTVALKKIIPVHSDQAHFIRMLSTEAKIHSYLNHPNIVQILDFFEDGGQYSIVLEYVDGKNLKEILQNFESSGEKIPWQAAVYITLETLKALNYAHKKQGSDGPLKIIHRDVSPHNILISFQGEVKLSDFGIARAQIERDETISGVLKGKYKYLSPEQILNDPLTPASDLFSVGVTLYEMLTSKYPFGEHHEYQTLQKIVEMPHTPILERDPSIDPRIAQVADHALSKKPDDRYPTAHDFYNELMDLQDPVWIRRGHELFSQMINRIVPMDQKKDEPIEKTSMLVQPILTHNSLFESAPTVIAERKSRSYALFAIIFAALGLAFVTQHFLLQNKTNAPIEKTVRPEPIAQPLAVVPETTASKKAPVKIAKNSGQLNVDGPVGTRVYVNGKNMGNLPIQTLALPPGQYTVLLDAEKLGQQIKKVTVSTKEAVTISWK